MSPTSKQATGGRLTIGLSLSDSSQSWTGGVIYLRNVVQCLAALPPAERPRVVLWHAGSELPEAFRDLLELDGVGLPEGGSPFAWLPPRQAQLAFRVARRLGRVLGLPGRRRRGLDVSFGVGGQVGAAVPHLHWIPDFQHLHLPHMFSEEEIEARNQGQRHVADQEGILLLSSRDALGDFRRFFPDARISPRVWSFVSLFSPGELAGPDPRAAYGLPEKYLYLPNQFWAHKDHLTAFEALRLLRRDGPVIPLICTGLTNDYRHPGHMRRLEDYLAGHDLTGQVRILGLVPRRDQLQVFRHAAAVLQPSLFEGWSTTIEDSKALGKVLLLSDLDVHREQTADYPLASHIFRRADPGALAELLARVWPALPPGPDPAAEQTARDYSRRRTLEAGRLFLRIAREALADPRRG